jgi:RNA polymerase sigma-70 factor, ECF subfamily
MRITQHRAFATPPVTQLRPHASPAAKRSLVSPHRYEQLPCEQGWPSFEAVYRSYRRSVYKLCLRMVRDPAQAEDLTQESFVRAFCRIHTFRDDAALSTWLYRLTTNVVLGSFRHNRSKAVSLEEIATNVPAAEPNRSDLQSRRILDRIAIRAAVDLLSDRCKTAFLLHDVQGYKHKEIARILGCSVGNSKGQLHRARKSLRGILGEHRQSL